MEQEIYFLQLVDRSDGYELTSGWVPLNRNVILDFNRKFSGHIENPSSLFVIRNSN